MQSSPFDHLSEDFDLANVVREDYLTHYIPVGCLVTGIEHSQEISSATLLSISDDLAHSGWITTENIVDNGILRITRIYALPYDSLRAFIDRSNNKLDNALTMLVRALDTSPITWQGHYDGIPILFDPYASPLNQSLYYIFNSLPSPAPREELFDSSEHRYVHEAFKDLLGYADFVFGLKTDLYPYQKRSAALMLQREALPARLLDPRLEERCGPTGLKYYFNAKEGTFFKDAQWYDACSGGILAETMGLGKTLICLALICATKRHPPKLPVQLSQQPPQPLQSLRSLGIKTVQTYSLPWEVEVRRMQHAGVDLPEGVLNLLKSQPATYDIPHLPSRFNRNTVIPPPRKITLAPTSIVVVPRNLCAQWQAEIKKHVAPNELNVLVMEDLKKALPPSDQLRAYDIILFSRNRFELEAKDGSDDSGRRMAAAHIPSICRCPYIGDTRERECTCLKAGDLYHSPLRDLHFKRLIIDEGHSFTAKNTRAVQVANELVIADHRWVVSGTPARDLLGVELDVLDMDAEDISQQRAATLEQRREFGISDDHTGAAKSLGALAANFLKVTPWYSDGTEPAAVWDDYIYRHEDVRKRTHTAFSTGLERTLQALVIKTRPEDVEGDIKLPPLHHEVKYLEPSYYDKLTANLFAMVLITNAITSERTDQDYLFHTNNQKSKHELIKNLRQSTFCWTGFSEADIISTLTNAAKYLQSSDIMSKCSPQDQADLKDVCCFAKGVILADPGWKMLAKTHELGFFVDHWPQESAEYWAFVKGEQPLLTGVSQLLDAQKHIDEHLDEADPGDGLAGLGIRSLNAAVNDQAQGNAPHTVTTAPLMSGEPQLLRRSHRQSDRPKHRKDNTVGADNAYTKSRIIGSTSAKLSYLLTRVLELSKDEKILIFYEGDNIAFYIAQALELLKVKHEIYARSLMASLKSEYVVKFNEQEEDRVLLMDVKQAAFGLNITSASRIFFVTPVCRPAIQAQAIKRAHRIGQTKEVFCETLILKGTIEEQIYLRSEQMTQKEHQDAKTLEDDLGIRSIVERATIVPLIEEEDETAGQVARFDQPQRLWGRDGIDAPVLPEIEPITKRKRASKTTATSVKKQKTAPRKKPASKNKVSVVASPSPLVPAALNAQPREEIIVEPVTAQSPQQDAQMQDDLLIDDAGRLNAEAG